MIAYCRWCAETPLLIVSRKARLILTDLVGIILNIFQRGWEYAKQIPQVDVRASFLGWIVEGCQSSSPHLLPGHFETTALLVHSVAWIPITLPHFVQRERQTSLMVTNDCIFRLVRRIDEGSKPQSTPLPLHEHLTYDCIRTFNP